MPSKAEKLKGAALRGLLGTVGRAATGVRIGRRHGFDSGAMLDHVSANRASGVLGIGRLIDRACLDSEVCRAVRARGELLKRMLREDMAGRGGEIVVLDVASGPGRCLQDLIADEQPGGQLRVVCRDPAPAELARGRRLAEARGLPPEALTYERGDAFDPAPPADGKLPDIIVVSGLYELVPDGETIRESLERLRGLLAPGGTLLFTTLIRPPQPEALAQILPGRDGRPLRVTCRPVEEAGIRAVKAGFAQDAVHSRHEEAGIFAVTRCAAG